MTIHISAKHLIFLHTPQYVRCCSTGAGIHSGSHAPPTRSSLKRRDLSVLFVGRCSKFMIDDNGEKYLNSFSNRKWWSSSSAFQGGRCLGLGFYSLDLVTKWPKVGMISICFYTRYSLPASIHTHLQATWDVPQALSRASYHPVYTKAMYHE
jgi:hypothetical protein